MSHKKRANFYRPPYIKKYLYSIFIGLILSLAFLIYHTMHQNHLVQIVDQQGEIGVLYSNQINDDLTNFYASSIASAKKSVFLMSIR